MRLSLVHSKSDPEVPGYVDCHVLVDTAASGNMVELFHQDLGRYSASAARAGANGDRGVLIGGRMQTAKITVEGITTDGEDLDRPVRWKPDGKPISALNKRQSGAAA